MTRIDYRGRLADPDGPEIDGMCLLNNYVFDASN